MKNINIGIVNLIVSNKLREAYFNSTFIEESKQLIDSLFSVIKNSPILQLEFRVFSNIENKHIDNDLIATRYIDNNIKLFEEYTLGEINNEHLKLKSFLTEDISIDDNKKKLYIAIGNLIKESLSNYNDVDVDDIHESFTTVLNHVKTPKKVVIIEDVNIELVNENVIEIAINKFNEKYDSLDENDKNLFSKLIKSNDVEKHTLLGEYKEETLSLLENLNKDTVKDNITKAIQKIKEMNYKLNSKEFSGRIEDDIIGLHELKKGLL